MELLHESLKSERVAGGDAGPETLEIRVCVAGSADLPDEARKFLNSDPLASEQGYVLDISGGDRPDFRHRAIDWGLWVEAGRWSYDWGDGINAYRRRVEYALNLAFRYKNNVINVDGVGWNPERFPGYGKLMREISAKARTRGIKTLYTGYGEGYGAGRRHSGPIFRNRRSYPDGEPYQCCGTPHRPPESATCGTCLSNEELRKRKQENFREFVRATEPGMIYIHNLDSAYIENFWHNRCDGCRKRWPNDDLCAPDGMAGAFAEHYDSIAEAVFSVRNDETDYDAARDCVCLMISPGYTWYYFDDTRWDLHVRYWTALSSCMKHVDGVQFGFREQFDRDDGTQHRFRQMADALKRDAKGHGICAAAFAGGDGADNDLLYCGGPALNWMYDGAETVMQPCGHAYQEPMQVLCAEYAWRSRGSAFLNDPGEKGRRSADRFVEFRDGKRRPRALYGEEGFLGEACRKLYGEKAGRCLAEINRAAGKHGAPSTTSEAIFALNTLEPVPVPFLENIGLYQLPFYFSEKRWLQGQWSMDLPESEVRLRSRNLACTAELNVRAVELLKEALTAEDLSNIQRELFEWYVIGYDYCGRLAELLSEHYDIYAHAQECFVEGPGGFTDDEKKALCGRLKELAERIEAYRRDVESSRLAKTMPIDYLGGAAGSWLPTIDLILGEVSIFRDAVEKGERGTPEPRVWW